MDAVYFVFCYKQNKFECTNNAFIIICLFCYIYQMGYYLFELFVSIMVWFSIGPDPSWYSRWKKRVFLLKGKYNNNNSNKNNNNNIVVG